MMMTIFKFLAPNDNSGTTEVTVFKLYEVSSFVLTTYPLTLVGMVAS